MARIARPSRAQVSSTSTIIEAVLPNRTIATEKLPRSVTLRCAALPIVFELALDARHIFAADGDFVTRFRVEDLPAPDIAPIAGGRAMNDVAFRRLLPHWRGVGLDRRQRVTEQKLDGMIDHAGIHFASQTCGV